MFAVIQAQGHQYRVAPGVEIELDGTGEKGAEVSFDQVLLVGTDGGDIKTGAPLVAGAKVTAEVVGVGKEPKIYVFKFKRRKNYRRKSGHRQPFTALEITGITG